MSEQIESQNFQRRWHGYTLFAICALAFCVSLGTAMVSIAKALVLVGVVGQVALDGRKLLGLNLRSAPRVYWAVLLAVSWMLVTMLWSEAPQHDQWKYFYGHSRLLWLLAFVYLIRNQERAWTAIKWVVFGQIFVVILSWLMWAGVPIPFTKAPLEKGIPFTSYLEQPVMSVVVLALLWTLESHWSQLWGKRLTWLLMVLVLANVCFVMTGRTGYVVLLTFIGLELLRRLPLRHAWLAFALPALLAVALFEVSPRFAERVTLIKTNSLAYEGTDVSTSEGQRLDFWYRSVKGIQEKPWLGWGVGSFPKVYRAEGGLVPGVVSWPEQQYLFWWVDAGLIGLMLLLSFFLALLYDSRQLIASAASALINVTAVVFVMGMFNSPLFGVGTGEFFLVIISCLLLLRKNHS